MLIYVYISTLSSHLLRVCGAWHPPPPPTRGPPPSLLRALLIKPPGSGAQRDSSRGLPSPAAGFMSRLHSPRLRESRTSPLSHPHSTPAISAGRPRPAWHRVPLPRRREPGACAEGRGGSPPPPRTPPALSLAPPRAAHAPQVGRVWPGRGGEEEGERAAGGGRRGKDGGMRVPAPAASGARARTAVGRPLTPRWAGAG